MCSAASLLSTSTIIHALWSPSLQPQSAWLRKCDPVVRKSSTVRAHATVPSSWGTSMRNLAIGGVSSPLAALRKTLSPSRGGALPDRRAPYRDASPRQERPHLLEDVGRRNLRRPV